jgi:hypothetical protein
MLSTITFQAYLEIPGCTHTLAHIHTDTSNTHTCTCMQAVRPDLLTLRVLGRALVMWSSIQPTTHWVEAQMAPIFRVGAINR